MNHFGSPNRPKLNVAQKSTSLLPGRPFSVEKKMPFEEYWSLLARDLTALHEFQCIFCGRDSHCNVKVWKNWHFAWDAGTAPIQQCTRNCTVLCQDGDGHRWGEGGVFLPFPVLVAILHTAPLSLMHLKNISAFIYVVSALRTRMSHFIHLGCRVSNSILPIQGWVKLCAQCATNRLDKTLIWGLYAISMGLNT